MYVYKQRADSNRRHSMLSVWHLAKLQKHARCRKRSRADDRSHGHMGDACRWIYRFNSILTWVMMITLTFVTNN